MSVALEILGPALLQLVFEVFLVIFEDLCGTTFYYWNGLITNWILCSFCHLLFLECYYVLCGDDFGNSFAAIGCVWRLLFLRSSIIEAIMWFSHFWAWPSRFWTSWPEYWCLFMLLIGCFSQLELFLVVYPWTLRCSYLSLSHKWGLLWCQLKCFQLHHHSLQLLSLSADINHLSLVVWPASLPVFMFGVWQYAHLYNVSLVGGLSWCSKFEGAIFWFPLCIKRDLEGVKILGKHLG